MIVNPSTPIGAWDRKPTPTGRIIVDFLRGKIPAYVHTGLNFVSVRDVAEGHFLAAEKGKPGVRYILGNSNLTMLEFLELLASMSGKKAPQFRIPYPMAYCVGALSTGFSNWVTKKEPAIPLESVKMAKRYMFFDSAARSASSDFRKRRCEKQPKNPWNGSEEMDISTEVSASITLEQEATRAALQAREFFFSVQRDESHWCAELESNVTITAEYIFLCHFLKLDLTEKREKLTRHFLGRQNRDGSWSIARCWEGDLSVTAEAYLALRILGVSESHPALKRAQDTCSETAASKRFGCSPGFFSRCSGSFPGARSPRFRRSSCSRRISGQHLLAFELGSRHDGPAFHHFSLSSGLSGPFWLDHLWSTRRQGHPLTTPVDHSVQKPRELENSFSALPITRSKFMSVLKSAPFRELALDAAPNGSSSGRKNQATGPEFSRRCSTA